MGNIETDLKLISWRVTQLEILKNILSSQAQWKYRLLALIFLNERFLKMNSFLKATLDFVFIAITNPETGLYSLTYDACKGNYFP